MDRLSVPVGLSEGGSALWRDVVAAHELDASQLATLEEACRAKDRTDDLARRLGADPLNWRLLSLANRTADTLKQLLAALRLPDDVGRKPQRRGGARGAYKPAGSGTVSSLERARNRSTPNPNEGA